MKKKNTHLLYYLGIFLFGLVGCKNNPSSISTTSPNGNIKVNIKTTNDALSYSVAYKDIEVIKSSELGFQFKDAPKLGDHVKIVSIDKKSINQTWEQVWGEKRLIENRCEELVVGLQETKSPKRKFNIYFRVFNDGLGFRYEIPAQNNIDSLIILDELTQFNVSEINKAWWAPAYKELFYESLYRTSPLNMKDTLITPLTMQMENGLFMAIHEANLTDYAGINLYVNNIGGLDCDLTPWSTGEKVFAKAPMLSPWRTITIGENAGDLITSYIGLNLNEPNKIEDVSWIKPARYMGIWWSIHMGKYTWSQGPKHGATTKNTKAYMDFAARNGFSGVLVEGWNNGWDFDWTAHGDSINFTEAFPDFDLEEIARYGNEIGAPLIGHHETGGMITNYESQMEDAFKLYQKVGVHAVKTGYVNHELLDKKEFHSSQYGVRHFRKVIETAAKYQIMINNHEPAMPTGLRRTYPNLMSGEGVRGQEYDAWSPDGGNPPEHTTIIPFTRGLAGPMDFTMGTFNFKNTAREGTRVQTTIAKQLALYVVIYSPMQMASDLPENYEGQKAFDFIKSVPVDWDDTRVLNAEIGKYVITARKDKNSKEWFVGAITNEESRSLEIKLDFLDSDLDYTAEIYKDGKDASWETNPTSFEYLEQSVNANNVLSIKLASGGGQAIRFTPTKN